MKDIIKNTKQALDSNYSTSVTIKRGSDGLVKITAVARFKQADANPFFCKWVTYNYADQVYKQLYGKSISTSTNFQ